MADPADLLPKPPPVARPTGIPRISRLPILKPTNANASPQPRVLRTVASTSKLGNATSSAIERPSNVRRGLGSTVRVTSHRDLPQKPRLEDVFKKPAARPPSRQAREHTTTSSSGGIYNGDQNSLRSSSRLGTTDTVVSDENTAPAPRPRKGPRPSLSDRTIESLANIPASPKVRRRSSFFTTQSPMASSRPSSSLGDHAREPSSSLAQSLANIRAESPTKQLAGERPSSNATVRAGSRPAVSGTQTRGAKQTQNPKAPLHGASGRASGPVKSTRPTRASAQTAPKQPEDAAQTPRKTSNSSASLREQIRLAKQTHRNSPKRISEEDVFSNYDQIGDPFNQGPKDQVGVLAKRIRDARLQGRLNISAMGFKVMPKEVATMYEFQPDANENWGEFVDLVRVTAADNEFESLPDELFPGDEDEERVPPFAGVETFDLHGNRLSAINLGLTRLENLSVLNLSRNQLSNAAVAIISQIENLRELRLAENLLEGELPVAISALQKLEILDLQSNKLSSLPDTFAGLRSLRVLNVANNSLGSLALENLEGLPLVEVVASKNTLSGTLVSSSVTRLARLQRLDLSCNSLTALNVGDLYLPALRDLDISFNRFTTLPVMTSWISLTVINAEDNNIAALPQSFTELRTVRTANFAGNDIRKLDPEIALMEGLESLNIAANPMAESKFMSMSTEEVKRTLKGRLAVPAVVDPLLEVMESLGVAETSR